jgi:uncharacterized tellurite resistance protein B-like protein
MSLLDFVRTHLLGKPHLDLDQYGHRVDTDLVIATIVLLLETAYGDHEYAPVERDALRRGIKREFGIAERDAVLLMERADKARGGGAADLASISAKLSEGYDVGQRKRILDLLWKIIYADKIVDADEVAFADQVAAMAGLTRDEAIECRRKAFVWFSETRTPES